MSDPSNARSALKSHLENKLELSIGSDCGIDSILNADMLNESYMSRLYEQEDSTSVEDDGQIMYFEFEIKSITHGQDQSSSPRSQKEGSTFLNIVDITSLIKNH